MKGKFYFDADGWATADFGPGNELLVALLGDFQNVGIPAETVLNAIDKIERGEVDHWQQSANFATLELDAGEATIFLPSAEPDQYLHLPFSDIREALQGWSELVSVLPAGHRILDVDDKRGGESK